MRLHPAELIATDRAGLAEAVDAQLGAGRRLALVSGQEEAGGLRVVYAFLGAASVRAEVSLLVPGDDPWLPSLAGHSYQAGRFERELHDLFGVVAADHPQPFRLVRHAHWPPGYYPLRADAQVPSAFDADAGFPFVEVDGKGVYEIPVGPVHAGLIEPGHFRFSVVGETIVRMYQRLYFVHRGVEKLFIGRSIADGIELAERISGDTAVGHSLAYLMAVEDALGIEVGLRARLIRALLLELERLYNHVNDLGAIINDAGFGVANSHAGRLRETLLRHNATLTGHRLLRGALALGSAELLAEPDVALVSKVAAEVAELVEIATTHSLVANRLNTTAVLPYDQAVRLGVLGYVARASGVPIDARIEQPFLDLGPEFAVVTRSDGDVRSRFDVRAGEVAVSARLVADLAARIAAESVVPTRAVPTVTRTSAGLGVVEAWRGTLVHRVEVGPGAVLKRVKVVDPSFLTWPGLPVALNDVIVPDFPLANKSFNCSYAGNDL
jgi:Ni,Fe-hydrogenase III large subunit/Ni,Fe-hydrogenase III component G